MTIGWIEEFVRNGEVVDGFEDGSSRLQAVVSTSKLRWIAVGAGVAGAVVGQAVLQLFALNWRIQ
jgi:hypothetical protein